MVSSAKGAASGNGHRTLISDFGLCKKLDVDQNSFMRLFSPLATVYQAPDSFSLEGAYENALRVIDDRGD